MPSNWNKGLTKNDPRVAANSIAIGKACRGRVPWNKGLMKTNDLRVAAYGNAMIGRRLSKKHRVNISRGMSKLGHLKGRVFTPEWRAKISAGSRDRAIKHAALELPECRCYAHRPFPNGIVTNLEKILADLLKEFPQVIFQQRFGRHTVDAYIPYPYHIAFEADGNYWHNRSGAKRRDQRRDRELFKKFKLPVIRLTEAELLTLTLVNLAEPRIVAMPSPSFLAGLHSSKGIIIEEAAIGALIYYFKSCVLRMCISNIEAY